MTRLFLTTTILLILTGSFTLSAQKATYEANLLIPYNDDGKWGWSDTLGNVLIKPKYKEAGFFYKQRSSNNYHFARVKTKVGRNFHVENKGLLINKKYAVAKGYRITNLPDSTTQDNSFTLYLVQCKKKKTGIYSTTRGKLILAAKYDTINEYGLRERIILVKTKEASTFQYFDLKNHTLTNTGITKISKYKEPDLKTVRGRKFTIAHYQDKSIKLLTNGEMRPFEFNPEKEYKDITNDYGPDMEFDDAGMETLTFKVDNDLPAGKEKTVRTFNYNKYGSFTDKYGFRELVVVQKGNKLGIINEKGEAILPFEYDKFVYNQMDNYIKLYKGDKAGLKILFTTYPMIEAKYDTINYYFQLRVNPTWSFALFKVTKGDKEGLVGENGLEYFDF
jgi:hypothetical protein